MTQSSSLQYETEHDEEISIPSYSSGFGNSIRISHTAAYIAIKFYGLTKDPKLRGLFDEATIRFYEHMVSFLPRHLSWYQRSLDHTLMRSFFTMTEEALLPGDLMHIIARKYYIGQEVDRALEEGYRQVVILGSGFDHLGARLSAKGIPCFELDMPLMTDRKQAFMETFAYDQTHHHLLPVDVTNQRISRLLKAHPDFKAGRRTLFVAEGFFDYLSYAPSEKVLGDIRDLNRRNKLITTFFSLDELNLFHRFVFTSGVSLVGESIRSKLTKEEFIEFLSELNFTMESETGYQTMRNELLRPVGIKLPVLKGFYVLVANQVG